ncbi:MAG: Uma2 family endonuclease [Prochlorothrix sp.]
MDTHKIPEPVVGPDRLPSSEELPYSDDTPVDNEDQNLLPNWLFAALEEIWADRRDWYFAADMAVYDREGQRRRTPTVVPDGFLALGVPRYRYPDRGRLSYVISEENDVVPIMALEHVSHKYGGEYDRKFETYAQLGVLYYVIYNSRRRHKRRKQRYEGWAVEYAASQAAAKGSNGAANGKNGVNGVAQSQSVPVDVLEVYRLEAGVYRRIIGDPVWMPEVGLGIGCVQGVLQGRQREWLAWFNEAGVAYPLVQERAEQERQRAEQERQRAEQERQARLRLLEQLRQMGIDPSQLEDRELEEN